MDNFDLITLGIVIVTLLLVVIALIEYGTDAMWEEK